MSSSFFLFLSILTEGKIIVCSNQVYAGVNKNKLVYTHPTEKQCDYSVDLSDYYNKSEIDTVISNTSTIKTYCGSYSVFTATLDYTQYSYSLIINVKLDIPDDVTEDNYITILPLGYVTYGYGDSTTIRQGAFGFNFVKIDTASHILKAQVICQTSSAAQISTGSARIKYTIFYT